MIRQLDLDDRATAAAVHRLLQRAYRAEARKIGVAEEHFPPLRRTLAALRAEAGLLEGAVDGGDLVAVVETRMSGDAEVIEALAVDPLQSRRGWGSALVARVLARTLRREVRVETAAANAPALALYAGQGFVVDARWRSAEGIALVRLRRGTNR